MNERKDIDDEFKKGCGKGCLYLIPLILSVAAFGASQTVENNIWMSIVYILAMIGIIAICIVISGDL